MKALILLTIFAFLHVSCGLMTISEFGNGRLIKCYDPNAHDSRRISARNINGQTLPLPNSIETFISLVERYESMNPNEQVGNTAEKLLKSFRIDDLASDTIQQVSSRGLEAIMHNNIKRAIFGLPEVIGYQFSDEDFSEDEQCALHFMLSHTVNDSKVDDRDEVMENDPTKVKKPREIGVVSLHSKKRHAFALGRVLLGIYAAFTRGDNEDIASILQRAKKGSLIKDQVNINPVYAVTMGDLITRMIEDKSKITNEPLLLPNGEWSDLSCPLEYQLSENTGGFVTYSELRGALDGLILGWKIQTNRQDVSNYRLSQILRQYYGYTGLTDTERTRWCNRENNYDKIPDFQGQMVNYRRLYRAYVHGDGNTTQETEGNVNAMINNIKSVAFKDIEKDECSISEQSQDRKYVSPRNIFAIVDTSSIQRMSFQAEVIGNLSSDFDIRPHGNLVGVYSNIKPIQQNTLDVISKNSGIAGCPSCFAKYYTRTSSKADEAELFRDLNDTFTTFDLEQEELERQYGSEMKSGSPGKIVLYFNFGSSSSDNRVQDALWDLRRHYTGVTILAVGDNRESLANIVKNDQTDIFPYSVKTIQDLKLRIRSVPGEFTFKNCNQSSARESDNKQEVFIPSNKIQYWAMYPQYFLKSFKIILRFIPQDGAQIRVCFTRSYALLLEGRNEDCHELSSSPIEFRTDNPCKKRTVHNCDPFYFSVEAKRTSSSICTSLKCSTPTDVQFVFQHEGISCNVASYISVSTMAIILGALMFYLQRQ